MRSKAKMLLAIVMAIVMVAMAACGKKEEPEIIVEPVVEYVTVSVIGGTLENGFTRDVFVKGTDVKVITNARTGEIGQEFIKWEIDGATASTSLEYTFAAKANTTITAVHGVEYSVWDGTYPTEAPATYVEDAENFVIDINSAEALAYFAKHVSSVNKLDVNTNKYSEFNWNQFEASKKANDKIEVSREKAAQTAWTLNINVNLDMAGFPWTPIMDLAYGLDGLTFEGNNNIIKNLAPMAYEDNGNNNLGSMKAAGLFGQITASSITFQNLTFDNAFVSTPQAGGAYEHLGVIVGYAHGGEVMAHKGTYQVITFDNVSVLNSTIVGSAKTAKHGMFIARIGAGPATEFTHLIIKNSCSIGNTTIGGTGHSALLGNVWQQGADKDIFVRNATKVDIYNNKVQDFTAITAATGEDWNHYYMATTGATWDYHDGALHANVYNSDYGSPGLMTIDLHLTGTTEANAFVLAYSAFMTDATTLVKSVQNEATGKDLFVVYDINLSQAQQDILEEWEQEEDQFIYMVNGATVTGHTFNNVRFIDGSRNKDGELIVRDVDGEIIGAWVIDGFSGSFVAAE